MRSPRPTITGFFFQPFDLPERLIGSDADYFLRQTLKSWCKRDGAISEAAIATYAEAFNASGAIHAACEDYRAAATVDLEHDRADDEIFRRVAVPMLVLWGGRGTVGRQFDVLSCWREKSDAGRRQGYRLRTLPSRKSANGNTDGVSAVKRAPAIRKVGLGHKQTTGRQSLKFWHLNQATMIKDNGAEA